MTDWVECLLTSRNVMAVKSRIPVISRSIPRQLVCYGVNGRHFEQDGELRGWKHKTETADGLDAIVLIQLAEERLGNNCLDHELICSLVSKGGILSWISCYFEIRSLGEVQLLWRWGALHWKSCRWTAWVELTLSQMLCDLLWDLISLKYCTPFVQDTHVVVPVA